MANVLRQIKNIVYRLKRQYGVQAVLEYRTAADEYNLENGGITRHTSRITIKRAILLPQAIKTDFVYDLSFIAANKNFTYGGEFQTGTRIFIIDAKDLMTGFKITTEMLLITGNRKFTIAESNLTEGSYSWLIKAKQVLGGDDDE